MGRTSQPNSRAGPEEGEEEDTLPLVNLIKAKFQTQHHTLHDLTQNPYKNTVIAVTLPLFCK